MIISLMARMGKCEDSVRESWYTRYPHYPSYCSTPNQTMKRTIPPLEPIYDDNDHDDDEDHDGKEEEDNNTRKTRLLHVTVVTRHGTRTIAQGPSKDNYQCWKDFWTNKETGVWDCSLRSMVMPPSPERVLEEEEISSATSSNGKSSSTSTSSLKIPKSMLFFTTQYDALEKPLSNTLNGTCQMGQLLLQGYDQQVKNGEILRQAYLYESSEQDDDDVDTSLHLFQVGDGSNNQEPWSDANQLYLRSDDSQATLVSGQLIMRGLFEKELIRWRHTNAKKSIDMSDRVFPTISVHTTDHSRDILGGFREGCHALTKLQAASDTSWEYQDFMKLSETQEVLEFIETYLQNEPSLFDCLMSTICTDRPLPAEVGVFHPRRNNWYNRISDYFVQNYSFHLTYNDGGKSKTWGWDGGKFFRLFADVFSISFSFLLVAFGSDVPTEFSKLSMGPLWTEIMDHILPFIGNKEDRPHPPAKLAIYSGYDSTIMELLASLGAWEGSEWPPYASMVVLEIHEFMKNMSSSEYKRGSEFSSPYAFRLLYNGEVITHKLKGCSRKYQLCDTHHLLQRVLQFAKRNVDCLDVNLEKANPMHIVKELLTDTAGIIILLLIVAASALIGSLSAFYYLTGSIPTEVVKSRLHSHLFRRTDEVDDDGGTTRPSQDVFSNEPLHDET